MTIQRSVSRWHRTFRALPRLLAWGVGAIGALIGTILLWDFAAEGWK